MNRLLPCLGALFDVFVELKKQTPTDAPLDTADLRAQIQDAVNQFELSALEQLIDADHIHKAKYALIALIDEWIIRQSGSLGAHWMSHPLQLEYFGENTAGERFFSQLAKIRLDSEQYIDVLEIYYLCLELGYQGQYRLNRQSSELLQLKKDLFSQIQQTRKLTDLKLSPKPLAHQAQPKCNQRVTLLHWMSAAGLMLLSVFIVLMVMLSYQAKQDRKEILRVQSNMISNRPSLVSDLS